MAGKTKIRGRRIETDDFIKSVRNSNVDWGDDANTASQKAIAEYIGVSVPGETIRFYPSPTGTAVVTTSGHRTSAIWDIIDANVGTLYSGMRITVKVPVEGHATYGTVIRFNGGDMHPVVFNVNSNISTRYSVNSFVECTYDADGTGTYYNNANAAKTANGVWKVMDYDKDTNTTTAYALSDYYFRPYAGAEAIYRYKLCAMGLDNRIVPITVTNQENTTLVAKDPTQMPFRPWKLWFYAAVDTVAAGGAIAGQKMMPSYYSNAGCQYNFNATISAYSLIYLRGTYNRKNDTFTLKKDSSSPCTSYYTVVPMNTAGIMLSDYFVAEDWYILVGCTYSTNNYFQLFYGNPMYYFDGTNLIPAQTALNPTKTSELTNDSGFITINDVVNDKNFVYEWSTPETTLTIAHNLNKFPSVSIVDTAGSEIIGDVTYLDTNRVAITFSAATRGKAFFN